MKIDADAHVRANRIAGFGHAGDRFIHFAVRVDDLQFGRAVHLEGGEALVDQRLGACADVARPVTAGPGVHAHFVAHRAAQ